MTVYLIKPGFSLSYIRKQNRVAKAHERDVLSLTSPVFRPCACGHAHAKRSATVLQAAITIRSRLLEGPITPFRIRQPARI